LRNKKLRKDERKKRKEALDIGEGENWNLRSAAKQKQEF
jgi:hypothetical protein